nr:hypothetical protein CFP56_09458 [Quercus suber]
MCGDVDGDQNVGQASNSRRFDIIPRMETVTGKLQLLSRIEEVVGSRAPKLEKIIETCVLHARERSIRETAHLAEQSLDTISLAPARTGLSRSKRIYNDVPLPSAPFTAGRLDEILLELSNKYKSRTLTSVTEQTLCVNTSTEAGQTPGEDFSFMNSFCRRNSVISRNSIPDFVPFHCVSPTDAVQAW